MSTTTTEQLNIDPETAEILEERHIRHDEPIATAEDLTKFLRRVRNLEAEADDHKRVKAVEEAQRKRLYGVAGWLLNRRADDIRQVVVDAFASRKPVPGMRAKTWSLGPMIVALRDIPPTFTVTDQEAFQEYCRDYARELCHMHVVVDECAIDESFDEWPNVKVYDDPYGAPTNAGDPFDATRVFYSLKSEYVSVSIDYDMARFVERRLVYAGTVECDDEGQAVTEQIIIDATTGERVDSFVHCTPGKANGEVQYSRPKAGASE